MQQQLVCSCSVWYAVGIPCAGENLYLQVRKEGSKGAGYGWHRPHKGKQKDGEADRNGGRHTQGQKEAGKERGRIGLGFSGQSPETSQYLVIRTIGQQGNITSSSH